MSESSNDWKPTVDLDFELPVEPGFHSSPPRTSWESGYQISLAALQTVKSRPGFWEERDKEHFDVEFKM
jgi:hypothetical protein